MLICFVNGSFFFLNWLPMVSNRSRTKYTGTAAGPIQKHGLLRHAATVRLGGKSVASPFRRGRNGSTARELGRLPVFPGYYKKYVSMQSDGLWQWVLRKCRVPEWQIRIPFHSVRIDFMLGGELWERPLDRWALLHIEIIPQTCQ